MMIDLHTLKTEAASSIVLTSGIASNVYAVAMKSEMKVAESSIGASSY